MLTRAAAAVGQCSIQLVVTRCTLPTEIARLSLKGAEELLAGPALLTRYRHGPSCKVESHAPATAESSLTSTVSARALAPVPSTSNFVARHASAQISHMATDRPDRAAAKAVALPMPLPAPVTTTTSPAVKPRPLIS